MPLEIDRNSSIPLHISIRNALTEAIRNGEFKPGDRLPSERELQTLLNISRVTIRQALNDLERSGLIQRRSGKGTYVAHPRIMGRVYANTSFSATIKELGLIPSNRLLEFGVEPAFGPIAEHLGLLPGQQVIRIMRLRLANNIPLGIEVSHLVYELCPDLLRKDFNTASIFGSLRELGLSPARASQVMRADLPTPEEQKLLEIDASVPVIRLEWLTFLKDGRPIEFALQAYRGDRYQFASSVDLITQSTGAEA